MPSNITVTANTSTISVNETTNNVSVTSTPTTVTVGTASTTSNTEIRSAISATDAGGDGSFSYDSNTGVFTYTGPSQAEVVAHFSNVSPINLEANGRISIDDSALFSGKTTDDLAEGSSNLYFTNARARQSLSVTGGILTYSNVSGEIGLTSANVRSQISATSPINYNSSTGVISTTLNGIESTSSELATEGVMANIHAIYPSGRQYSEPYDVGLAYDSSTGGLTVIYPQKSFEARFVNTAIDTTRGHVLAVVGYDATHDIPIVDYLDITSSANNIVAGVYMESLGTVSNSSVSYPKVAVATEGYITSGAFNGLSGLKTGDILYATTVGSAPNTRGGYTATIPTNAHDNIVSPIGKIVEQDGTLYTLYIDVAQPAINTSNITLTQGNATTTAGRPVISVDGSEITTGTGGQAGITAVNTSTGHRLDLNLNSISTLSDAPGSFEVVGNSGGNNKAIALQDINLANLDNATAGFVSNAQAKAFIESNGLNATANIETNQFFIGDGSLLTGVTSDIETESVQRLVIASENVAKGDAVAITGGTGDNPEVSKALASNVSLMPAFGVMLEAVTATNTGNCLLYGEHTSIDMGSFGVGEEIFVSGATAGALSNVAPTGEANAVQKIGKVIKTGSGGKLTVQGAGRSNATPNLDNGKIFLGDSNNQSATVTPDSNFDTTNGTFSLSNSLSSIKQISPETPDAGLTLLDNNKLLFDGKISSVGYNLGNIITTGSVEPYSSATNNFSRTSLSTNQTFTDLVGSNIVSGMYLTSFGSGTTSTYSITEGSNVVQIAGLTTQNANGSFIGGAKTDVDIATHFRVGQTFRFNLGAAPPGGDTFHNRLTTYGFSEKAFIQSIANSSATGGIANVIMSEDATETVTLTCSGGAIGMVVDTVSNSVTGDRVGISGVSPSFVVTLNDITGMPGISMPIEGTNNVGANYFELFDTTSLSSIDSGITPSMISRSNTDQDYSIIDFESKDDGYFRFKDTLLIGTNANPYSRGLPNDVKGFGINLQWTGEDNDSRYGGTVQPGLLFQSYTDNALQGSADSFLQNAGPRILLSSMDGKISDDPVSTHPKDGQELGKYGWWANPAEKGGITGSTYESSTNPPSYITCQAGRDWVNNTDVDTETYFIAATAENSGNRNTYMYYRDGEVALGVLSSQKLKIGQSGQIGSDVRANSALTAEYLTVDSTETELFNRLQLYSLTTTEINALGSPQAGQMVYNSTLNQVCFYNGSEWRKITDSTM